MDTRINYSIATDLFGACARDEEPRKYLGMSEAGNPCDRAIWFRFRQFTPVPIEPRIVFLFRFGDKIEELVCTYLRKAGYQLEQAWPEEQASFSALGGLLHGHSDGIIQLPEGKALLEIKSANHKKFQAFALGGVRSVYEKYYWQAQLYMGCAGLTRALFVIVNKDDSNIHTEIMPFNRLDFDTILARLYCVLTSPTCPEIPEGNPGCAYCPFRLHCRSQEGIQTDHSCMSCNFLRIRITNNQAFFNCNHADHSCEIFHPDMTCPGYSWLGRCPF